MDSISKRISSKEEIDELAYALSCSKRAENLEYVIKLSVDEILDNFSQDFTIFVPFNYKVEDITFRIELQK